MEPDDQWMKFLENQGSTDDFLDPKCRKCALPIIITAWSKKIVWDKNTNSINIHFCLQVESC